MRYFLCLDISYERLFLMNVRRILTSDLLSARDSPAAYDLHPPAAPKQIQLAHALFRLA